MVFAHSDVKNSDSRVTMKPFKMDNFATVTMACVRSKGKEKGIWVQDTR